jgi:transcription antitermination factor NusG
MENMQRLMETVPRVGPICAPNCPEPSWYAVHTCAHHERTVAAELAARDVHRFLPTYRSLRRWKDRRVELDFPLFPGYLFVFIALRERQRVLEVPSVVRMVGFAGRPEAIPAKEIEALQAALLTPQKVAPHPYITKGCRVRVRFGPLKGTAGVLVRKKNQCRLVLCLHLVASSVSVEVDATDVELIR